MNSKNDNNSGVTFTFSGPVYNYGTMSGDVVNHFHDGKLAEAAATSENPSENTMALHPSENVMMPTASDIPAVFSSSDSITLMQRLIDHHLMDDDFQPIGLTWSERSILVDELSSRLNIVDKWQTFGTLWHLKPQALRSAYNKAMEQKKTSAFFDKIRNAMEA